MSRRAVQSERNLSEELASDILAGRYQPGDFIPKEMQICEASGLSRTVVRRHLAQLVDGGLIERISGYGSRVREVSEWHILDPLVTRWLSRYAAPNEEIQREILSFRLSVEPQVAMVAARNASARDLVAIEEAFEGMARHMRGAGQNEARRLHSESDVAFHVAIYRATHNIVWAQLSHILRPSIDLLVVESNSSARDPDDSLQRHRDLMEAIRMRQPQAAFHAAYAVLEGTSHALGLKHEHHDLTPN
ncbi:FadR/GntR family transcriptional regulator [Salinisphaera sp. Q1T1-3]|uniref:FadR/GntR family transcriptional regulator n=1 Tax=Salinisphaera sp. Q1T1-3 TaxID=2321229 RepID=UPI000E7735DC|nr:FCD domain-containing protein [Salinisphaera sp. Q1T1-3]RJS92398.1 FadR family transcriptional regulator [Salinisphaera sp. Q1T1-3]